MLHTMIVGLRCANPTCCIVWGTGCVQALLPHRMLVSRFVLPAAQAKPGERTSAGNQRGMDDFQASVSQQVPGNNPEKNAESFSDRECCMGFCHGNQSSFFPRRGVFSLVLEAGLFRQQSIGHLQVFASVSSKY